VNTADSPWSRSPTSAARHRPRCTAGGSRYLGMNRTAFRGTLRGRILRHLNGNAGYLRSDLDHYLKPYRGVQWRKTHRDQLN
jgi:hypothetical protein